MIFKTYDSEIDLSYLQDLYDKGNDSWLIKLSGGADSALVAYILARIIQDNNMSVNLHAVTGVSNSKPYNAIFAKNIMEKVTDLTGLVWKGHHTGVVDATRTGEDYANSQEDIVQRVIKEHDVSVRFAGITANPPKDGDSEFLWNSTNAKHAPSDSHFRDKTSDAKKLYNYKNNVYAFYPLINCDKRQVASFYEHFNLIDELFPITRSCEEVTDNFDKHCGKCWFCLERQWGFGKL